MNTQDERDPEADPAPIIDHEPIDRAPADHAPLESQPAEPILPPPLPPPLPPKTAQRRSGGGAGSAVLLTFLLCALLGGAGYYAWTNPSPDTRREIDATVQKALAASDQADSDRLATLSQQLAALTTRVEKLEQAPPPAPAPAAAPTDLGDLPKKLDDLSARVDALANRPEPSPPGGPASPADNGAAQQAVADLSQRTSQAFDAQKTAFDQLGTQVGQLGTTVNTEVKQLDSRIAALEQGLGQARGTAAVTVRITRIEAALVALQAGKPLGDIPGAPLALSRFATIAPPTEAHLREQFAALADHAQAVSEPDLSGRSFWQRALTRLQSAVTVRQGHDVLVGDPAAGILSDARAKVSDGDLAGAVAALRQLTGPAASVMQGWIDEAAALIAARAALADLAAHA